MKKIHNNKGILSLEEAGLTPMTQEGLKEVTGGVVWFAVFAGIGVGMAIGHHIFAK